MRIFITTIALLAFSIFCCNSYADEVVFKNGERLIGTFERLEEGKLIFKSQIAGEVTVDLSQIKDIYTEEPMDIHLLNGTVMKSKSLETEEEHFAVEGTDNILEQTILLSDLSAINPKAVPKIRLSGNITAGFTSSHGSSFSENTNIAGSFGLRTKDHRLRINARYVVERNEDSDTGDHETSKENFTVRSVYDYFFTKKIYGYWSERYKTDHIDDLNYRFTSVWGAGYQWAEKEDLKFSTFAGPGLLQEKYSRRVSDESVAGTSSRVDTRRKDFIIQSGYHFEWKPIGILEFTSNLAYNPKGDDFSFYNLTHDSEVRAFITGSLYASFKFILEYDSHPAAGSSSTDTDYIFGMGWEF